MSYSVTVDLEGAAVRNEGVQRSNPERQVSLGFVRTEFRRHEECRYGTVIAVSEATDNICAHRILTLVLAIEQHVVGYERPCPNQVRSSNHAETPQERRPAPGHSERQQVTTCVVCARRH